MRRPYQVALNDAITAQHAAGVRNVLARLPTGAGKTVTMAYHFAQHQGASIGIAHRQELVSQISLALARNGVRHRLLANPAVVRACVALHMQEIGTSYYHPGAPCGVAGIDTLIRRDNPWLRQVTLWQTDEAHHLLRDNKWGQGVALFPNALGIGWTATPGRADGKGLGSHADGVFDAMVSGPEMRELIEADYLTDYRIFCPPSDLDLTDVPVSGATGDYSAPKLRAAVHKSHIVGDVVGTYVARFKGQRWLTFAVDVEHALEMTQAYRAAGVRVEMVTAETPDVLRGSILRRFRSGELDQLVNVDLFGEGFDVPECLGVSMARPTASYNLFAQQFGRALRPSAGKTHGTILDHVGNVIRHGLPDAPHIWTLDRRERRARQEPTVTVRYCSRCTAAYERVHWKCPYCGYVPEPMGRDAPERVEGDLTELDPATLRRLRGEVDRINGPTRLPEGVTRQVGGAIHRNHTERQAAQQSLREAIALWAGWRRDAGDDDREIYRRFWITWGVDVMTAQTLGATDAATLEAKVRAALQA